MTTDDMLDLLKSMQPGTAGAMIRNTDLVAADIPNIPDHDLKARAKWLVSQLPFKCEYHSARSTLDYVFKRADG
jgi:hypothetical protein